MLARMRGDCNEYERALHERGSAARSARRRGEECHHPPGRVACERGAAGRAAALVL